MGNQNCTSFALKPVATTSSHEMAPI